MELVVDIVSVAVEVELLVIGALDDVAVVGIDVVEVGLVFEGSVEVAVSVVVVLNDVLADVVKVQGALEVVLGRRVVE